ncbi:hypothetical protein VZO05_10690 [Aggregatilineales bacterium SYSU G02658]
MTPDTAQQHMDDIQSRQRSHLPALAQRLAQTYLLPLGAALLLATVGAALLAQLIPSSTTTAVVFALNVGVFYYGWNYMEQRTHATALFSLYVAGTRERRALARLIAAARAGDEAARAQLADQAARYDAAAQAFIQRAALS